MAEFSNAHGRADSSRHQGSESPSVDVKTMKKQHNSAAGWASRCTPTEPSHGMTSAGTTDDESLDSDTTTSANQVLPKATAHMTTPVPTTTASTSSPVSKDETAPPSAPLEPASTSEIDEDVGIIITDEDFCEVADIFAADNGTVEFTPPGTAPATGVAAGGDEAEASNRLAPLSPSTADLGDDLCRLWEDESVADTAAVESAASQAPLTISLGNGANDGEASYAGLASTSTPDLATSLFSVLWGIADPPDSPVATAATSSLPASTVDQARLPPIAPSCPNADNEPSTPAPDQETAGPNTMTAPATSVPAGKEEALTRSNAAVAGTSTLSATALPFIPSTSTTEAASATVGASTADANGAASNGARNGGDTNAVRDGVAEATSTTLPYGQGEEEAEAHAERSGVAKSTLSAAAKPFAPSTYTREAASTARETWMETSAVILAKAKEQAVTDARAELEATVGVTPEEQREARHNAAAAAAAAETPTRPQGANQWSQVDALTEGLSVWRLSGTPSASHVKEHEAAQRYVSSCFTAAGKFRRSDCIDQALHLSMDSLTLNGDITDENAMRGRKAVHSSTQKRLEKALEMGKLDLSQASCVSTTIKVDNALSDWFNQLTLEEAATPQEEEARHLQRVTARTSMKEAFTALVVEKEGLLETQREKRAAAAREQKMLAVELQQREAIWEFRARAQAARQTEAKRNEEEAEAAVAREEEAKAAAALEQQRVAFEEKRRQEMAIRACLVEVKRRRSLRIHRFALSRVTEEREDKRSLYFPCSNQLRYMWREGKVTSRGCG